MSEHPLNRRSRFSLREAFLALTAFGCAMGWAYEFWTRPPRAITLDQAIEWMGSSDKMQVDCRNVESERVGDDGSKSIVTERVLHWLIRESKELPND